MDDVSVLNALDNSDVFLVASPLSALGIEPALAPWDAKLAIALVI